MKQNFSSKSALEEENSKKFILGGGHTQSYLIFAIVLLGQFQNAVTETADLAEGGVFLVQQFLHLGHPTLAARQERRLQDFEDLRRKDGCFCEI